MNKTVFLCCTSLLLSACVTVSELSVMLPAGFDKENILLYAFEEPAWRLNDDVYEQQLGKYHIVDADVSGQSTKSSVKEREIHSNGFLNWAVFGESLQKRIERWDTRTQQQYSFRLDGKYSNQYSSRCEILTEGATRQVSKNGFEINSTSQSRLLCQVANDDQTWNLLIEKLAGHNKTVRLWQDSQVYDIKFSKLELSTFDHGVNTQHANIPWQMNKRMEGVFVYDANKLVSVNALIGQPKIWLDNSLPEQDTTLLLSVNYAISMYDWLSDDLSG